MVSQSHIASQYFDQTAIVAEKWSDDTTLYQPYEAEQILLAEHSSSLAVRTYLRMCNLNFNIKTCANAEFMSPGGHITKLPFIRSGAFVIPEMEHIIGFVESKGTTLTSLLDADQKFDLRAYMSLTEHIFSNAEIYMNWIDKDNLNQVTYARNGSVYPWPLNHIQNWRKKRHFLRLLDVYGWRNYQLDDVLEKVRKCCETLSEKLGNKQYFYGDNPTELDALVFGHLFVIITTELPNNELSDLVKSFNILVQFTKRVENNFFVHITEPLSDNPVIMKLDLKPAIIKNI